MSPPLDDHVLQERNLQERYQLSDDVLDLFRAYGEHHRGVEPPEALGRRLRTSTLMRTCTNTISSLVLTMQRNPTPEYMAECNEALEVWFQDRLFKFRCSCELDYCLRINESMKPHLRSVEVHWRGEESASAFKLLREAPKLRGTGRGHLSVYYQRQIYERDAAEELVADRRLEKITVEHVERTTSYRRSNQEWASLHKLISDLAGGIKLEDYSDGRYQPPKHRAGAAAADDDVGKF